MRSYESEMVSAADAITSESPIAIARAVASVPYHSMLPAPSVAVSQTWTPEIVATDENGP